MTTKMGKSGAITSTILGVILVGAILVLVNVISAGVFIRADLTEGKEFTISDATKEMLGELRDLVTITVYMSEDLPSQLSTLRRQISDMLDEYRNYGRGQVQIDFVDPAKDPQTEQKMRTLGIPQITAQILEKDQFQSVNIYLGIVVSYLDNQEVLPVVQDTYTLEYDLTAAILKVSRDRDYVVGVLTGPVEHEVNSDLTQMKELLDKQFTVRTVNLQEGQMEVADDIDLLIIAGPNSVSDGAKYRIDQYIMRGGRAIFMVDAIKLAEEGALQAVPVRSGVEDLLAHYGVRVQNSLALDRMNATASFSSGFIRYTLPYPYWLRAVPDLLNSVSPITNRLESLVLPWTAPLEIDMPIAEGDPITKIRELEEQQREAQKEMADRLGIDLPEEDSTAVADEEAPGEVADPGATRTATVLARTSPQCWTASGYYDLNPQQRFSPTGSDMTSRITAVAVSGRFGSFYQDRAVPSLSSQNADGEETLTPVTDDTPIPESPDTRVVVIGNAHFATDSFLAQFPANSVFLLNTIDWMTLGDRLISIRSRGATDRPLKVISDTAKSTVKVVGILGTPLLVIAFGLLRFGLRRKASAAREAQARMA